MSEANKGAASGSGQSKSPGVTKSPGGLPQVEHGIVLGGIYLDRDGGKVRPLMIAKRATSNELLVIVESFGAKGDKHEALTLEEFHAVDGAGGAPRYRLHSLK